MCGKTRSPLPNQPYPATPLVFTAGPRRYAVLFFYCTKRDVKGCTDAGSEGALWAFLRSHGRGHLPGQVLPGLRRWTVSCTVCAVWGRLRASDSLFEGVS